MTSSRRKDPAAEILSVLWGGGSLLRFEESGSAERRKASLNSRKYG